MFSDEEAKGSAGCRFPCQTERKPYMDFELETFDRYRRVVSTGSGPVSYVDTEPGTGGPAALFIHGVGTSSYLWRNVIARVKAERRCVALDLPLHGSTPGGPDQDYSLAGLATVIGLFCDAVGIADLDVVANDTGGAVAQIFATRQPDRLRTLTLTNCETHDNVPPKAFRPTVWLARSGLLALVAPRLLTDIGGARKRVYGAGYQHLDHLPEELVRRWLTPLVGDRAAAREFQRWLTSLTAKDLLAVEPALASLRVPTLIVWGTSDRFFHRSWAYWLRDTIPGVTAVVEVPDARLFFPDERPDDLAPQLLRHWT
jgi:pimeloyl-ACP methyl ester carboxylesterase